VSPRVERVDDGMVLPVRIELTTSPYQGGGRWALAQDRSDKRMLVTVSSSYIRTDR